MRKKTNIILALLVVSCSFLTAGNYNYYARFHPRNWGRSAALPEFFITTKIQAKEIPNFLESRDKPSSFSIQMDGRTFDLKYAGSMLLNAQKLDKPMEFISDDRKHVFEGQEYVDSELSFRFTSPVSQQDIDNLISRLKTELDLPPERTVEVTYSDGVLKIKMRRIIPTTRIKVDQPLWAHEFNSGRMSYSPHHPLYSAPASTDATPI